ncbi:MAG: hypothetical protein ACLFTK_09760 [Anaerolineales bacterium]
MPAIPTHETDRVRSFLGGGTIEEYHNGKLVAVITSEPTKEHIESWFAEMQRIYREWVHLRRPILLLVDATWGATTPGFRQRMMQINALAVTQPYKTCTAFLVQAEHAAELTIFATLTGSGTTHRLRVFTERDAAIHWLEQELG